MALEGGATKKDWAIMIALAPFVLALGCGAFVASWVKRKLGRRGRK